MDFKQIDAFVNVVRYKSFSKAADATFFSQPTISTHIKKLEKELGTKLLDRRSRSVELTPQGDLFYKYAVEMVNSRAKAIEAINGEPGSIGGVLEIQSSSIPSVTFLPELMAEFKNENSSVQYYMSVSDSDIVIDNILNRRGEIGFIGEEIASSSLETHLVTKDKSVLIAPLSYNIPEKTSIKDALNFPLIWRETGSATRKNFEAAVESAGLDLSDIRFAASLDDIDALIRNVEAGLGVSIVSEKLAKKYEGRIKTAKLSDFEEDRSFYMIYLKNRSLSPAAEAFKEFVLENKK